MGFVHEVVPDLVSWINFTFVESKNKWNGSSKSYVLITSTHYLQNNVPTGYYRTARSHVEHLESDERFGQQTKSLAKPSNVRRRLSVSNKGKLKKIE